MFVKKKVFCDEISDFKKETDSLIEQHEISVKKKEKDDTEKLLKIKLIEKDLDDNINKIDSTINSLKTMKTA